MRFIRDLMYTLGALSAAKSRTFLTMLGIIIGVASVLAVSSIGISAQQLVIGQVQSLGSNLIGIIPGASQENGPPPIAFGIVSTTLTIEDVRALSEISNVVAASPYVNSPQSISLRGDSVTASVLGVNERYMDIEDAALANGRFFSSQDISGFGRVVILGHGIAEELSPGGDLVGRSVRIKGLEFLVIGVFEKRGSAFFQDSDSLVLIPVTTAQKLIAGINFVTFARLKVDDEQHIERVKEDIKRILRRRHGIGDPAKDDFSVRSTDQAISVLGNVTGALKGFLMAVTAISLVVGGINIMNVMYVSVRERTREIGLRKALGARPARILIQFLTESAFISFFGGLIGVVVGIAISVGAAAIITRLGYDWQFILPFSTVFMALAIAAAIGVFFGVAPARTAANLDPISALRYE